MIQMNRRHLVVAVIVAAVAAFLNITPTINAWAEAENNKLAIEQWMDQWMSFARQPVGTLHVSRFKDPIYYLTKPIAWKPNQDQASSFQTVDVPIGFVTDFASIPRIFWSVLRPDGDYVYAAIIHDYLYWTQTMPRSTCDDIFRLAMQDFDVDSATAMLIYQTVRTAGIFAWEENARLKVKGEKRILKQFPDDPRVSWSDWKKRPEVFVP